MKVLAAVACIVGAIAALWFALQAAGDLYLTGFPDSHFAVQLAGVPWYFGTHLGLDNGIGG